MIPFSYFNILRQFIGNRVVNMGEKIDEFMKIPL